MPKRATNTTRPNGLKGHTSIKQKHNLTSKQEILKRSEARRGGEEPGNGDGGRGKARDLLVSHGVTDGGEHLAELRLGDGAIVLSIKELEGGAGVLVLLLGGGKLLLVEALEGGEVNVVV